jgi:hypothetical protein
VKFITVTSARCGFQIYYRSLEDVLEFVSEGAHTTRYLMYSETDSTCVIAESQQIQWEMYTCGLNIGALMIRGNRIFRNE